MERLFKIICILLLSMTIIMLCNVNIVRAEVLDVLDGRASLFYHPPEGENNPGDRFTNVAGNICGIIQIIGIIVSVLALMIIGIREMTASLEEKSRIKDAMPGYLVGIFLVAAMTSIPNIIYQIFYKMGEL